MRFSDITGHAREKRVLERSVASATTAHSYLFAGPEGVGKRLAALALASALNCVQRGPGAGDACGECQDCRSVAGLTHPNVTVVEPVDGLIKIDRVREVQEKLRYRIERGMKVVIVDGADKLKKEAANAFLKTLEEPPPETLIVLVTSRATELLPTIHSRCQRLNFRPLPEEAVRDLLVSSLGVDPAEAAVAARLSAGSVARAARYAGQERGGTRREVLECVSRLDPADTAALLDAASEWSRRDDLEEALEVLKSWYRDKAVTAFGAGRMVANTDMAAPPGRPVPFRGLYDSFTAVEKARAEITPPRYGNRLLVMENLLLRLAECGGLG